MMLQGVQSATALGQKGWAQPSGKGEIPFTNRNR